MVSGKLFWPQYMLKYVSKYDFIGQILVKTCLKWSTDKFYNKKERKKENEKREGKKENVKREGERKK